MALTLELLSVLNDNNEPLSKRLCIASNAFKSFEFLVPNKESVLFEWFSELGTKLNDENVWNSLNTCLISKRLRTLKQDEIRQDVLTTLIRIITNRLNENVDSDLKQSIFNCAISILKDNIFQQYFVHDVKRYCLLISSILNNTQDLNNLVALTSGKLLFNKYIINQSDYNKYFLIYLFEAVVNVVTKFHDRNLIDGCKKLVQQAIFPFNSNEYIENLKDLFSSKQSSNKLLTILQTVYELEAENARIGFRVIFEAFLTKHKTEELLIYNLFIVLLHTIGFKINKFNINLPETEVDYNWNKSLLIIADIIELFGIENVQIEQKINKIKFTLCLRSIIKSVIRLETELSSSTLKILKALIVIDPLIINKSFDEIITFVTLSQKSDEVKSYYSIFMISLLEMFLKLHRFETFTSKLLVSWKSALYEGVMDQLPDFEFKSKMLSKENKECIYDVRVIFPENVVQYFHQCVTLQTNEQALVIMKSLVDDLNETIRDLEMNEYDSKKSLYVQLVSDLLCQFLLAVRVVEHTTSELIVNKFLNYMTDLKGILNHFGNVLLKRKHNHSLMYSFLNICYIWADLAILFTYYSPVENINFKNVLNTNGSIDDLTYFHDYLTSDQWTLILQRILNFDETCQHILEKLLIQHLRSVFLFEPKQYEPIETNVRNNFVSNLKSYWTIVLEEKFMSVSFIPKMDTAQIISLAELLLNDILKTNNFTLLKKHPISNCRDLTISIFYVCLLKINNLFKKKRKHDDSLPDQALSVKIFRNIDPDLLIRKEIVDLSGIIQFFNQNESEKKQDFNLNEDRFDSYLNILKNIPVCFLSENVQMTLFLYLLSICMDLKENKYNEKCEEFLIALVENSTPLNIFSYMSSDILMQTILKNTLRYKEICTFAINKAFKFDETITSFKPTIKLIGKNVEESKYFNVATLIIHAINKTPALKNSIETETNKTNLQDYKISLCKYLETIVLNEDDETKMKIETFALLLQYYLSTENTKHLTKLIPKLEFYLSYIIKNSNDLSGQGVLLLFEVILKHQNQIETLSKNFVTDAWDVCKRIRIENETETQYLNTTVNLLLRAASSKNCTMLLSKLANSSISNLQSENLNEFKKQLQIWNIIIKIETIKPYTLVEIMQPLLERIVLYTMNHSNYEMNELVVKFLNNIIKSKQIPQTTNVMHIYFQTIQILIQEDKCIEKKFVDHFNLSFSLMETLFNNHKVLLIDRLPVYLLNLRIVLKRLCAESDSNKNLMSKDIEDLAHCAFRVEKLVSFMCKTHEKNLIRIAPYVIADVLKLYEDIALCTEVKTHLNNCLYALIDVCDQHGISYLLGALSTASTEIFKFVHHNYEQYYKFKGKT